MELTQENIRFHCPKCNNFFIATPQDYKIITTPYTDIKEGYCPVCGTVIQINPLDGFYGSGGGKF